MNAKRYRLEHQEEELEMSKVSVKDDADVGTISMLEVKKVHAIAVGLSAVIGPLIAGLAAYFTTIGAIRSEIQGMRTDMAEKYVKKEEFKSFVDHVGDNLGRIAENVAEVKGYLSGKQEGKK